MSASADIQTKTKSNVISVPINAVTTREKGTDNIAAEKKDEPSNPGMQEQEKTTLSSDLDEVVFLVQKDGQIKKIIVKTDVQDINYIEVTKGLNEGMEVVSAPYNVISKTLKEGMKVKVVPKEQLFTTSK
jgi:HlyD family secretion protein